MRQALHILRKDVRYLRYDLLLVLTLDLIFGWMASQKIDSSWVQTLLPIAAAFMIVRLIHAETIPGDTQFWITRPYRWRSLAGAKLLFILVFIELPVFAVQFLILIVEGFPLVHSMPGLIWTQVLMVFGVWLPIAALAAMTAGLASFVFSLLTVVAVAFVTQQFISLATILWGWRQSTALWPPMVEWLRLSILIAALIVIGVPVLYLQYRQRQTMRSRQFALAAAVIALAAYVFVPWQFAMIIQSYLSRQTVPSSSVQVIPAALPAKKLLPPATVGGKVNLHLPLTLEGAPQGTGIEADALETTIQLGGGLSWKSGLTAVNSAATLEGTIPMDRDFYTKHRNEPATIQATIYLTLYGNTRSETIPFRKQPVNTLDGLQCYNGDRFDHLYCRSAFRWPDATVYTKSTTLVPLYQLVSYSPFPSGISLDDAIEAHWADSQTEARTVTIVIKEPLAHLHREFEVHSAHLADFAVGR